MGVPSIIIRKHDHANHIIKETHPDPAGGSDEQGTFKPTDSISRAEAAAILARLILPARRFGPPPMPS